MISHPARSVDALGIWRTPLLYGAGTVVVFWCAWYFTKIPCTPHNVAASLCNPGWLARFINVEILALAVGAGIAIVSLAERRNGNGTRASD